MGLEIQEVTGGWVWQGDWLVFAGGTVWVTVQEWGKSDRLVGSLPAILVSLSIFKASCPVAVVSWFGWQLFV